MRTSRARIVAAACVAALVAVVAIVAASSWRHHPRASAPSSGGSGTAIGLVTDTTADAAPAARAPGCANANAPSRESPTRAAMTTPSGRSFHVWGPSSYDASRPYPVVLAFHGWSSNGRDFAKWFKMEEHVAGAAFVVYPDSRGVQWDFSGASDLDFTGDILEGLGRAWCVDRARVLAVGFSYGGRFVNHLGCKRPDLVRGIVAGGGSWDPEKDCSPMAVLVVHRTRDETMPITGGKSAALRWSKVDGCESRTQETDAAHGCTAYRGCAHGSVTFCEDTHHDPSWSRSWNHTIREEYRELAWQWFRELR